MIICLIERAETPERVVFYRSLFLNLILGVTLPSDAERVFEPFERNSASSIKWLLGYVLS